MLRRHFILFVIIEMSISLGACQPSNNIQKDTLSCVNLTDDSGLSYKIVQTVDLLDNHRVDSSRTLSIFYDTKKAIIHLPIPDEEVKNFSIEKITKNHNGITLITTQGGGDYIVRRHFVFITIQRQLFLDKIVSEYGSFDSEEMETDVNSFRPNLLIDEIELTQFL